LVEHDLAKVGVASSSLVFRSKRSRLVGIFLWFHPGGGIGRRAGLKILFPATEVRVQFPSRVLAAKKGDHLNVITFFGFKDPVKWLVNNPDLFCKLIMRFQFFSKYCVCFPYVSLLLKVFDR
jgi:hypothetical protein